MVDVRIIVTLAIILKVQIEFNYDSITLEYSTQVHYLLNLVLSTENYPEHPDKWSNPLFPIFFFAQTMEGFTEN